MGLPLLLGRADEDLVYGDVARTGHDVGDGVCYVFGPEPLDAGEPLQRLLADLLAQVAGQLGGYRTRLDERARTWRPATSWRRDSLKAPTPNFVR